MRKLVNDPRAALERRLKADPEDQDAARALYALEERLGIDHMVSTTRGYARWNRYGSIEATHKPTGIKAHASAPRNANKARRAALSLLRSRVRARKLGIPSGQDVGLKRDWTPFYAPEKVGDPERDDWCGPLEVDVPDDFCRGMR